MERRLRLATKPEPSIRTRGRIEPQEGWKAIWCMRRAHAVRRRCPNSTMSDKKSKWKRHLGVTIARFMPPF